jgi:hypothetical protein
LRSDDKQNEAEGEVHHTATVNGQHSMCFDNTMSRWTAKVVSWRIEDIIGCESQIQHRHHTADVAKLGAFSFAWWGHRAWSCFHHA